MNKLIDEALKKIVTNKELLEELLLIDNIDDLYELFISQKSGYDKNNLVNHFVQIAKDNMVSEENLENISGGTVNQKLSKVLCLSLSALTLASLPISAHNVSENTSATAKSTQNKSKFSGDIKGKIAQKIHNIQNTIKEHPITSATAASSLAFYGLYKVIYPIFESSKEKNDVLKDKIQNMEDVRRRLEDYARIANQQRINNVHDINLLRADNENAMRRITQLSNQIQDYIRNHTADNTDLTNRLNALVDNVTNLQNRINRVEDRNAENGRNATNIHNDIQQINNQIRNILGAMARGGVAAPVVRDYRGALRLNVEQRCALTADNGSIYLTNYITNIHVDINNRNNISHKLDELCEQFHQTEGLPTGDELDGWEQSANEYFFTITRMYRYISEPHKTILAQCIEAMYQNKNNPLWHDEINTCLVLLSQHGGHCSLRGQAITNSVYSALSNFVRRNGIGQVAPDPEHNIQNLMNDKFSPSYM